MEGSGGNATFFPFAGLLGVGVCSLPRTCGTAVWTPLEDVHWSPATGLSAVSSGATRPRVFLPVLGRQERALKSHSAGVGGDTGQAIRSPSMSPWRRRGSLVLLLPGPVMPANWPPSVLRNSCSWAPVWWEPSAPSFSFVCIAVLGLRVSGVIFQGEEKHPPSSRQPGAGTQLLSFTSRHRGQCPT